MIILVANLGSTSFKYKLYDMASDERVLAVGAADRIGGDLSAWSIEAGGEKREGQATLADHAAAIELHLGELAREGVIESIDAVDAVGFKAVHGGPISGAVIVDDHVLETMGQFADVAPAHNPMYIAAMKAFAQKLPKVPQVAAFETAFHQTIAPSRTTYAIPYKWTSELGIRRYGFHGASHRYIATRMGQLSPSVTTLINCHLGGSSSLCAIRDGKSVATSMGLTPQTGVPQSGRVGDFDIFALLKLRSAGIEADEALRELGKQGGLLGISGVSSDLRDIKQAAGEGNGRAQLAIEVFVEAIRDYIGAYMVLLGGADAITFTGGIGQYNADLRAMILSGLDFAGVEIDPRKNDGAQARAETRIDADGSRTQVWVLPTNEELIVARQTLAALQANND
ncbi:acetate/propionate family kinase [Planctomycetales bacterium ZRK34]|nr:acetate/propionate family kinase [Planctomycetales bacterium ZRK34]